MDSGCTSHICNNKLLFTDLCPTKSAITTAGVLASVEGIGTAQVRVELDEEIINFSLINTLLVPSLPVNLISQSKLNTKFYLSTKNGYQLFTRDSDELTLEARLVDGLYVVNQEKRWDTALIAKNSLAIWHEHLVHISVKCLQSMRDGKVTRIKFSDDEVKDFHCDTCVLGKMHRASIRNLICPRSDIPGTITHWDICGPMPLSFNQNKWLVGVDDATRLSSLEPTNQRTRFTRKFRA